MRVLSEYEYRGERYAGVAETAERPGTLYRVGEDWLRETIIAARTPEAVADALGELPERIAVPADAAPLRSLVPLLPSRTGNALVSGFMRTHRSKFENEPSEDEPFVPPNWFFKGLGGWLRVPGEPLVVPDEPVALIEEPEIMLVYVNDDEGTPHYAGYTFGNDLCDIGLHRQNPGWNPYCKLCDTALVPRLFLGEPPMSANGETVIERGGEPAWRGKFECGGDALYFRIRDMTEHLFGFPALRRPGLVNYVLLGADEASFHQGFRIADGDRVVINVLSHGVTMDNVVRFGSSPRGEG